MIYKFGIDKVKKTMDIKLIKTNTNKKLLQELFHNMSRELSKDEIQQYIFAGNLNYLIYLVKEYNNSVYRKEVVLSYLINLIAQVSLNSGVGKITYIKE